MSPGDVMSWLDGDRRLRIEYNPDGSKLLGIEPGALPVGLINTQALRSSDGAIDGRLEVLIDADVAGRDLSRASAARSLRPGGAAEAQHKRRPSSRSPLLSTPMQTLASSSPTA